MLLAHSTYFRETLHEDMKNGPESIPAEDLTTLTVKNLLRYDGLTSLGKLYFYNLK
jgi:hypothetical protein